MKAKKTSSAVDCVVLCSALALILCHEGVLVTRQRSMTIEGCWPRQSMDSNYDQVMFILRDHLDDEGSIDIRPLPEVPSPSIGMIPGLPERMLKRFWKEWGGIDVDERSSAISDLALPAMLEDGLSTMRLEELMWHRAMISGMDIDIASQLHLSGIDWLETVEEARVHASRIADFLIKNGHL